MKLPRNQAEAWAVAAREYPFACCVVCGVEMCLEVEHMDQDAGNNAPENLAWMCGAHHSMYDVGLYPLAAIKLLRGHWQKNRDKVDHGARMKDAGKRAAATRALRRARSGPTLFGSES